jgi:hypothetical protein
MLSTYEGTYSRFRSSSMDEEAIQNSSYGNVGNTNLNGTAGPKNKENKDDYAAALW